MTKQRKKQLKKVWRTLKTAFKILFTLIILAWLLHTLGDFMETHNALVEKVNQQSQTIDTLNFQVNEVTELNTQLQTQLQLQELRIDDMVNERLTYKMPLVSLNNEPVVVEPEVKPTEGMGTAQVITVTVLQILKTLVFRVPAI